VLRIWRAAKLEARAKGLTGEALMRETNRRAQQIVDRTQPTWDDLTVAGLVLQAKRRPLQKLATTMFSSQRAKNLMMVIRAPVRYAKNLMMVIRAPVRYARSQRTAADFGRLVRDIALPTVVNGLGMYAAQRGVRALWEGLAALIFGRRNKESNELADAINGTLERVLGNWLIVGDVLTLALRKVRGRLAGKNISYMRSRETLLWDAVNSVITAVGEALGAMAEAKAHAVYKSGPRKGQKKAPISAMRSAEAAAKAIALFGGIPIGGPLQAIRPMLPTHRTPPKRKRQVSLIGVPQPAE